MGVFLGNTTSTPRATKCRIDGPTSAIESKTSADRAGASQHRSDGTREPQAKPTPYSCSGIITIMSGGTRVESLLPDVEVQRRSRQQYLEGGHDVVGLGGYGMGTAFRIKVQVTFGSSVDSLQAGLNLLRRTGAHLQLPEHKSELPAASERRAGTACVIVPVSRAPSGRINACSGEKRGSDTTARTRPSRWSVAELRGEIKRT